MSNPRGSVSSPAAFHLTPALLPSPSVVPSPSPPPIPDFGQSSISSTGIVKTTDPQLVINPNLSPANRRPSRPLRLTQPSALCVLLSAVCCTRYISVLVDLTHVSGASLHNARAITHQLTDVSIRVPGVRRYAVKAMCDVLLAGRLLTASGANNCMSEVLHAAAFIVGEFSEYVEEHVEVIRCLMRREVGGLSGETQNVFVQSVMKVLAAGLYQPYNQQGEDNQASMDVKVKDLLGRRHVEAAVEDEEKEDDSDEMREQLEQSTPAPSSQTEEVDPEQELEELDENGVKKRKVRAKRRTYQEFAVYVGEMLECLYTHLPLFCRSSHVEVQERAVSYHELVTWMVKYAQMQPFISVSVDSNTAKLAGDAQLTTANNGEAVDSTHSNNAASPALNLLDDTSVMSSHRTSNNAVLPPAAALSSIAIQLCMLFSERLNPVSTKAQRKVPVPKGLDLSQPIHDGWDVDSEASDKEEDSEEDSDANDRGGNSKRRDRQSRGGRKKDQEREKGKGERQRSKKSGGLYSDDDYTAPLTAEEKVDAKRRLEARKQAQMNDPFYLSDRKAASTQGDDSGVKQISRDELPAMTVVREGEKERKKSKKRAGDDDDIFAGVGDSAPKKTYKVHKAEDMPSDALSSEDGAESDRKDQHSRRKRDDRQGRDKDSSRRHKERRGGRESGRRGRDEEKDRDEDADRDRERRKEKKKSKERQGEVAAAVDEFDLMAASSSHTAAGEEGDMRRKRKDREKGRVSSSRDGDREKDKERKKERRSAA